MQRKSKNGQRKQAIKQVKTTSCTHHHHFITLMAVIYEQDDAPKSWSSCWLFFDLWWEFGAELQLEESGGDFIVKILESWRPCLLLGLLNFSVSYLFGRLLRRHFIIDIEMHLPHYNISYPWRFFLWFIILDIKSNVLQNFRYQMTIW